MILSMNTSRNRLIEFLSFSLFFDLLLLLFIYLFVLLLMHSLLFSNIGIPFNVGFHERKRDGYSVPILLFLV